MVATKSVLTAFATRYGNIPVALRNAIENASVLLKSTDMRFTASGVILKVDGGNVHVLTALHNAYVRVEKTSAPEEWDDELLTGFRDNMKIWYNKPMPRGQIPGKSASITSAVAVQLGETPGFTYDVMLLKSADEAFHTFATTNAIYHKDRPFPEAHRASVELKASRYLTDPDPSKAADKPTFYVQTGFGNTEYREGTKVLLPADTKTANRGDNQAGRFQFRMASVVGAETATVYNQIGETEEYDEFQHGIQVTANANDSTESGDSGGPLFVVRYNFGKKGYDLHLIGVTTGSDMATSKTPFPPLPPPKPKGVKREVRANNIVTSLEEFYSWTEPDPDPDPEEEE